MNDDKINAILEQNTKLHDLCRQQREVIQGLLEENTRMLSILSGTRNKIEIGFRKQDTAQEWISVNDRLPDAGAAVLICRPDRNNRGRQIVEQGYADVNGWWRVYGTRTKAVTHWMPMPRPAKTVGGK